YPSACQPTRRQTVNDLLLRQDILLLEQLCQRPGEIGRSAWHLPKTKNLLIDESSDIIFADFELRVKNSVTPVADTDTHSEAHQASNQSRGRHARPPLAPWLLSVS